MTNILYITPSANTYGSEKSLLSLLNHIDKNKYNPTVLLLQEGPYKNVLESNNISTLFLDYGNKCGLLRYFRNTVEFIRLLRRKKIGLIHINLHTGIYKIAPALLLSNLPLVSHIRMHSWINILDKMVISRCKRVICVSEAVKRVVSKKRRSDFFSRIKENEIKVVYNGRNLGAYEVPFDKTKLSKSLGIKDGEGLIGFIGSLTPRKAPDLFIRAASIVSARKKNVRFLIVGDIYKEKDLSYKDYVVELCKKLNLEDRCIFTGVRKDIVDIMRVLDVLVIPSKREALGSVLIEGMAAGTPIVARAIDGNPEVLGDNEAGILLDSDSPEEFAQAAIRLLDDKELAKNMGKTGKGRVRKYFDVKICAKKIEGIYESILTGQA